MPRQRNRKSQGCQTVYDNWVEHQIHEGVEKIAVKIRCQVEDQVAKLISEIETKLKSDIEAKMKPEIEAKLKLDVEAKMKPEIEAKLKSDIEARLKPDIEAKLKKGIESKLKQDIKTKLKSDIVAQLESDFDAKVNSKVASTTDELQGKIDVLENEQYLESLKLQNQLSEKDTHIRLMMEKIDQLEQFTKANNILIVGMKEEEGEDITTRVVKLVKKTS